MDNLNNNETLNSEDVKSASDSVKKKHNYRK